MERKNGKALAKLIQDERKRIHRGTHGMRGVRFREALQKMEEEEKSKSILLRRPTRVQESYI